MLWDTENDCLDSTITFPALEEARSACDSRNHQIQGVEYLEDGGIEYVDEMPQVYKVRKVVAEYVDEWSED